MAIQATTLRPGLLVSLKSTVTGNVHYARRDIEREHIEPDGMQRAVWETERTVDNPDEHKEAIEIRGKCRSLVTGVCSKSSFGLLCPDNRVDDLALAVRDAQSKAAEFNARAELTRINIYVIAGRIAADDVQAMRAINSEVRELLETVEVGLQKLDVSMVRDAANRATQIGRMLSSSAQETVKEAVAAARSAARRIVKAAEQGAAEVDAAAIEAVRKSRTAFLDLEGGVVEVATPEAAGRAIDLTPETGEMAELRREILVDPLVRIGSGVLADAMTEGVKIAAPPVTVPAIEMDKDG